MRYKIFRYNVLDSTNNEAERLIKTGDIEDGSVFVADFQRGGRGQGTNSWHSADGKNLLFSLVLKPAFLSAGDQYFLSKVVCLAICDCLNNLGIKCEIKWPNDILVSGKKVGGILIENRLMGKGISHSIIGVGLNVNQESYPPFSWEAYSMKMILGNELDVGEVLGNLLEKFTYRYNQLKSGKQDLIDKDFHLNMFMRNEIVVFSGIEGLFHAKVIGVNSIGEIEIENEGKIRSYGFHEIRYTPPG